MPGEIWWERALVCGWVFDRAVAQLLDLEHSGALQGERIVENGVRCHEIIQCGVQFGLGVDDVHVFERSSRTHWGQGASILFPPDLLEDPIDAHCGEGV